MLLILGFSVRFWDSDPVTQPWKHKSASAFVNSIILTTSGEKNPKPAVPRASGTGISRSKKRHFDPFALHIVVSLSHLLENFPLALGSFSNWSAVFQRLLCMLKDKGPFIKQNGEALASRKGGWMLWPLCLSSALYLPPRPSPGSSLSQWREKGCVDPFT